MTSTSNIPQNPFRPGAGTQPLYLAGRSDEQREFEKALQQHDLTQNIIITGLRGVGKTVLLDQLKPLATKYGWLWVGNDLNEASSISDKDICIRIIVDLAKTLSPIFSLTEENKSIGFINSNEIKKRPLNFEDLLNIYEKTPGFASDKIKEVLENVAILLNNIGIKGIVFAYDEAQNLKDKREASQFPLSLIVDVFSSLQKRNIGCQFLLVMTGLPTLITNLNESRTYTERMFHTIVLDRLSENDTIDAIKKPIEISKSTLTFSKNTVDSIAKETKGYPFLIQYICRELFDAWIGRMTVGEAASIPMKEIIAKLDIDFFLPRWNRATDRQQIFMQVIATLPDANGEFSVQDITNKSRDILKKPFNPSHATQMLGHLIEKGLIYRNRRGSYCFAVPLLAEFISRQPLDQINLR